MWGAPPPDPNPSSHELITRPSARSLIRRGSHLLSGEQNGGPPVVPHRPTTADGRGRSEVDVVDPALAEWRAASVPDRGAALLGLACLLRPILRMRPQHGKRCGRYGARSGPPHTPSVEGHTHTWNTIEQYEYSTLNRYPFASLPPPVSLNSTGINTDKGQWYQCNPPSSSIILP